MNAPRTAAELLRRGMDPQRVADLTTLTVRQVVAIARSGGQVPCDTPWCGHPQAGPGHPRKGSIRVHQAGHGDPARWFCSWQCVRQHAARTGAVAR